MGQHEVLVFLQNNKGRWLNAMDIAKGTKCNYNMVTRALRILREFNLVNWMYTHPMVYKHKDVRELGK